MDRKINIVIVDDIPLSLDILEYLIHRQDKFNLIGRFTSGVELLEFPDLIKTRILLMDIEMPEINGLTIAKVVNLMYPHVNLIAVTMYQDRIYLEQLIKAGFKGFVNKCDLAEKLFPVINDVLGNKFSFPPGIKI